MLGLLIGAGVLFAWRHSHGTPESAGERRVAVLPFQNLGDSADAYFADGITDAVRGKLTALPGLRVTGSNSSSAVPRNAPSRPRRSGVSWAWITCWWERCAGRRAGGASRVQVSPELIEAATG